MLQALLFLVRSEFQHIVWMILSVIGKPVTDIMLPLYAFWHFDDFSWGNTRVVQGAGADPHFGDADEFDADSIPKKTWEDFNRDRKKLLSRPYRPSISGTAPYSSTTDYTPRHRSPTSTTVYGTAQQVSPNPGGALDAAHTRTRTNSYASMSPIPMPGVSSSVFPLMVSTSFPVPSHMSGGSNTSPTVVGGAEGPRISNSEILNSRLSELETSQDAQVMAARSRSGRSIPQAYSSSDAEGSESQIINPFMASRIRTASGTVLDNNPIPRRSSFSEASTGPNPAMAAMRHTRIVTAPSPFGVTTSSVELTRPPPNILLTHPTFVKRDIANLNTISERRESVRTKSIEDISSSTHSDDSSTIPTERRSTQPRASMSGPSGFTPRGVVSALNQSNGLPSTYDAEEDDDF